ncbi:alpha/beta hydrolase [Weissella paramesenteroides]|uniref:alpha/beta hydrolase n=1 Tax=Weissella paramesenteroides TaxID=1249 RepID=UPI0023F92A40|nr:alpha/beta hydrolase [Weissella paramesenteroides]MDF8373000.1 alpha/beta hydrolase [Weissella paramesenteroides]WIG66979.1 alpha/beta hydrolase [Weissella paramesenteroides]
MTKQHKRWSRKRKIWSVAATLVVVMGAAVLGAGGYFFHVAEVRAKKDFVGSGLVSKKNPLYPQQQKWLAADTETWHLRAKDGTKLVGSYLPATQPTNKTVIVIHGFGVDHKAMAPYGEMFHRMGYNVFMPDNRAAGKSGGKYIGFGYLDAKDYQGWIKELLAKNGKQSRITVMGASMGGATTMMLSGMNPPKQVEAYIEDSGYTSVTDELHYEAGNMYGLPDWLANLIIPVVSGYSKVLAGYSYHEADAERLLAKNKRPMLFIHGDNDKFVPTRFMKPVYEASNGPKEKYLVPGAAHVESYRTNPAKYEAKVRQFLNQYFK